MEWTNKDTAQTFYTRIESRPDLHQCHLCGDTIKQKVATGYTNLLNHLKARHPRYREELQLADIIVAPNTMTGGAHKDTASICSDTSMKTPEQASNEILSKNAAQNQALVNFYFDRLDEDHYRCKTLSCRRVYAQRRGTGYTNLKYHLGICIGRNYEAQFERTKSLQDEEEEECDNIKSQRSESDLEEYGEIKDAVEIAQNLCEEKVSHSIQENTISVAPLTEVKEENHVNSKAIEKVETERDCKAPVITIHSDSESPKDKVSQSNDASFEEHKRKSIFVKRSRSFSSPEGSDDFSKRAKNLPKHPRTKSKKTNELLDIHQAMFREMIEAHEKSLVKFLQFEKEEREKDRLAHMQIMTTMIKAFVHPHL